MRFLIIIPVHNEEKNIFFCLKSLQNQSFKDFRLVVVNDGSTDQTADILKKISDEGFRFELVTLQTSEHKPGAKVVHSFNEGLKSQNIDDFDVICKFDADIIFPPDYLFKINEVYQKDPTVGMVSGLVKIKKSIFENALAFDFKDEKKQWRYENISSPEHVRGPIKSYRKDCFLAIGGLRPTLGWDNIDVMLAKMHGYKVFTIKNLWVKHLRPTAYKYKDQKAEKLGEYFYNIGLNIPLAVVSSLKSAWKNRSAREFLVTMKAFLRQNHKRQLSHEELKYIRKLRYNQLLRRHH